jgi:exodeoxyribonuclease V gamma subunit
MLTVHRSERADTLISPLAGLLTIPPADVFSPDVVAVPARGVERWLTQQLSRSLGAGSGDGIAANILFPSPAQLVADVLAAALGVAPEDDPWAGSRLVWTLLTVIDDSLSEPWCAMLADHLGAHDGPESHRRGRRYSTAASIAGLFSSYGDNRPAMLNDWAAGVDSDGTGQPLQHDLAWQPALWRELRERIGTPSPAERLTGACARLVDEPGIAGLPGRVSLFGLTRLPTAQLAVLEALAAHREIHLWLTHPSPGMWDELASRAPAARRADDDTAVLVSNPLLASLSRDVREMQQRLPATAGHIHYAASGTGETVLAKLQNDIRDERIPGPDKRVPADDSISIHACYGPARQVEVLRESLLRLLETDDTLEPRDIIVMCPDVATFAPLISAAFGQHGAGHPGHRLRVRLADRGLARTNPLLDMVDGLLRLAAGRVTASEVLDLAATVPVARQFSFTGENLETLRRWTTKAGARWALFEAQRQRFGVPFRQNMFSTARDRLLLGVTSDESELAWLGVTLPLDDVDSTDVDLAGRFSEYIDRLGSTLARLAGPHPARTWTMLLEQALDRLTDIGNIDAWQRTQASRELASATQHAGGVSLRLADVRAMLTGRLAPRPTRANFRSGELTVATLVPMRSVPHRVVALLGLDDDAFPRAASVNGDDILARNPCLGERDSRSEDRQLLLDAVMSATEHVVVCYTGADPVTGERRPPAAPLADLIDAVTATVENRQQVVTRQPLQPFDPANFTSNNPFSFDTHAHAGAQAAQQPPAPARPFLPGPLPAVTPGDVDLDNLVEFLANPALAFLRQRLGITLPRPNADIDNDLPLVLNGLDRWDIGDRMLSRVLAGASVGDTCDAEIRRGTLPPGQLGLSAIDAIRGGVTLIADAAATYIAGQQPAAIDVSLNLGDRWLTGTVTDAYGTALVQASYTTLSARHRVAAWVRLLAVAAATGASDWQGVTIGRVKDDAPAARRSTLAAPADPVGLLTQLVELRDRGLAAPLPLAPRASSTYATRRLAGASPEEACNDAARAWTSEGHGSWRRAEENNDKTIQFVYGTDAPFSVLWAQPAQQGESWSDEPNRFAQLARRVWQPLLDHEQTGSVRP